tara:strand:- start:562 stop:675 length:114 start_codon:yes stop_codon:yes gene_type:complete
MVVVMEVVATVAIVTKLLGVAMGEGLATITNHHKMAL